MKQSKIYVMQNPAFLADKFVFKNIVDEWGCGHVDEWFYIKINGRNKIEEIGVDIEKRISRSVDINLLEEATATQKRIFNSIDTEYWAGLLRRSRL